MYLLLSLIRTIVFRLATSLVPLSEHRFLRPDSSVLGKILPVLRTIRSQRHLGVQPWEHDRLQHRRVRCRHQRRGSHGRRRRWQSGSEEDQDWGRWEKVRFEVDFLYEIILHLTSVNKKQCNFIIFAIVNQQHVQKFVRIGCLWKASDGWSFSLNWLT